MRRTNRVETFALTLGLLLALPGCGDTNVQGGNGITSDAHASVDTVANIDGVANGPSLSKIVFDINAKPPTSLNTTGLMRWTGTAIEYNAEVIPYDLNTPSFSDYALKSRGIYIPDGTSATFRNNEVLDFPTGTIILKSFYYPADVRKPTKDKRLLETRLLVNSDSGWKAWPYLWAEDGSDATLHVGGAVLDIEVIDFEGITRYANYLVPQRNQCSKCHKLKDENGEGRIVPIGPKPRHLHREFTYASGPENQLQRLSSLGKLQGLPALNTLTPSFDGTALEQIEFSSLDDATVNKAARDYLDINCAHCHNPRAANGETSQLFLNYDNDDPFHLGICKLPGSAGKGGFGRTYNIVPGEPDESILMYRTETEIPGAMMPDISRSLRHDAGTALVYEWILRMPTESCDESSPAD